MLRGTSESEAFSLGKRLPWFTVLGKYPQFDLTFTAIIVIWTVPGITVYPHTNLTTCMIHLRLLPIVKVRRSCVQNLTFSGCCPISKHKQILDPILTNWLTNFCKGSTNKGRNWLVLDNSLGILQVDKFVNQNGELSATGTDISWLELLIK